MSKAKIHLVCGAYLQAKDHTLLTIGIGERLMVASTIHKGLQLPKHENGGPAQCLFSCPCKGKSRRKRQAGYNENGDRGYIVTCLIKEIEVEKEQP